MTKPPGEGLQAALVANVRASYGAPIPERLEGPLRTVPRHAFLPAGFGSAGAADTAVPLAIGADGLPTSSSTQPSLMIRMAAALGDIDGARVLEIGTGSGYNAALLAAIVGPQGHVVTVDIDERCVKDARAAYAKLGLANVTARASDLADEHTVGGGFDAVIITASVATVPTDLARRVRDGGRVVAPLWLFGGIQRGFVLRKEGEALRSADASFPCSFMRLRGRYAGPEGYTKFADWVVSSEESTNLTREVGPLLDALEPFNLSVTLPPEWFVGASMMWPRPFHMISPDGRRVRCGALVGDGLALLDGEGSPQGSVVTSAAYRGAEGESLLSALGQLPAVDPAALVVTIEPAATARQPETATAPLTRRVHRLDTLVTVVAAEARV